MSGASLAWYEIYDELRSRIKSGELRAEASVDKSLIAPGASESDFSRAIERLLGEGLLRPDVTGDITIARTRARSRRSSSFHDDYTAQGRLPSTKTIDLSLMPIEEAPSSVQEALDNTSCSMLVRHYHVQSVDGVPHAIADSFVPYELVGKRWKDIKAGNHNISAVLSELGYQVTEKQETLFVDSPTLPEREHLAIVSMPGVAVVRLNCIVWALDQIVEICLLCDRADLYEFTYRVKS
ncbi:MAG: UTRA domain-containing protein [Proteobacteria bacterium]|nr:UTRA domain-containing protein [Pseudomonadota bacterium]